MKTKHDANKNKLVTFFGSVAGRLLGGRGSQGESSSKIMIENNQRHQTQYKPNGGNCSGLVFLFMVLQSVFNLCVDVLFWAAAANKRRVSGRKPKTQKDR